MSTSKHITKLCCAVLALTLLLTVLFLNGSAWGIKPSTREIGYESQLFDTERVHSIDIIIDDWDGFLDTCEQEEYTACSVVIDGETYKNVGLRAKGNTSLSSVSQMGSDRYSFKIEFDQYDNGKSYHGLDKLCLNNLIQDNTYMKDYLTYRMMAEFGVESPLCSYAYITVNGEDWGLYLAVEGVEDGFLQRNYGSVHGALYKPDSMSFGGGRGNGAGFRMEDFANQEQGQERDRETLSDVSTPSDTGRPASPGHRDGDFSPPSMSGGGGFGGIGSADVKLQYIDNDPDSYANIFDNAKTEVLPADQERLIASLKALSSYTDLETVLDTDAVLRYFVVHNFVVNGDSYTGNMIHNYYLYEEDGRLSMIPWDYNLAFGTFQAGDAGSAVNDPIDEALTDRPMQAWIFSDETYTAMYHTLFAEFLDTIDIDALIDSTRTLIAPYVEQDPTKFCTYEEFETGVETLKTFCALRTQSIQGQLEGSIPSTEAARNADSLALIDASQITLQDMGSMDNGRGPGNTDNFDPGNPSGNVPPADDPVSRQPPENNSAPIYQTGGLFPPNDQGPSHVTDSGNQSVTLFGISLLALVLGIIAAKKFRC